jgi:hypothetical protein
MVLAMVDDEILSLGCCSSTMRYFSAPWHHDVVEHIFTRAKEAPLRSDHVTAVASHDVTI